MELKYFLCTAAGIASFVLAVINRPTAQALFVPPAVAGAVTLALVLFSPGGFSFLGPVGIVVFFFLCTLGPGFCALVGYALGRYAHKLRSNVHSE